MKLGLLQCVQASLLPHIPVPAVKSTVHLHAGRWRKTAAQCGGQGISAFCWPIQIPCPCPMPQPTPRDTSVMQPGTMEGASLFTGGLWQPLGWEPHLKEMSSRG